MGIFRSRFPNSDEIFREISASYAWHAWRHSGPSLNILLNAEAAPISFDHEVVAWRCRIRSEISQAFSALVMQPRMPKSGDQHVVESKRCFDSCHVHFECVAFMPDSNRVR